MLYVTRALVEVLLELGANAEPEQVTAGLAVTNAGEFEDDLDLHADTPVLTHFYLPETGRSVSSVFGMDLSTPPGQTQGRFVSHPQGGLEITRRDDLHGVVLVAIPPWEESSLAAFTRDGTRVDLEILDVEPPEEEIA